MKSLIFKSLLFTFALASTFALVRCNKATDSNAMAQATDYTYVSPVEKAMLVEEATDGIPEIIECIYECINSMPLEDLSESEIATLNYVREEEYLAHDVYVAMYELYNVPVFNNISNSEFIHSTAMLAILEKYGLPDLAANHEQGVFVNEEIQALYDALVEQGSASFQDALIVGATIEDVDIWDLMNHLENDVDNQDLTYALTQLYRGSRNHMRAYNAHLTFQQIVYTPQYITQELFDEIVNSGWEVGNGFCVCNTGVKDENQMHKID
jgi:hypothetical protein